MSDQADNVGRRPITPFDDAEYEEQCQISSMWTGSRVLVLASVFLFGAFLFAYFYLRALDLHGNWRVHNQHPSTPIGTSVLVLVLLAALVTYVGARRLQTGSRTDWFVGAGTGLLLSLISAGLLIWDLTMLPFHPASSAYAGLFITLTPVYAFYLLGQSYWIEVLIAQSVARPETVLQDTGEGVVVLPRFGANVEGLVLLTEFMAVVSIVVFLLFYVIN